MKKLLFNLQLFGDDADDTPVEETETKPVEDTETEPEFEDTSDEETKETKTEEEKKNEGKKETNRKNAERRIAEKQKKEQEKKAKEEQEKKEREAYFKGLKKALGDKNPYTDKPIVDDEDLEEYEIMRELENKGKDPIEDYAEYIKQQKREAKQKEIAAKADEEAKEKFVADSISEVDKKYGDGTAAKYLQNENFKRMFSSALEAQAPLLETIENFMEIEKYIDEKSEDEVLNKDARRKSSPGSMGKGSPTQSKSISKMSSQEFNEYLEKEYGFSIH